MFSDLGEYYPSENRKNIWDAYEKFYHIEYWGKILEMIEKTYFFIAFG